MDITARAQGFDLTEAIDGFLREQLRAAIMRFEEGVQSIDVFMKDINGPKGGVDKQVLIRVQLRSGQVVAAETTHENLYGAIKTCVRRSKRAIRRSIKRTRQVEKRRLRDVIRDDGLTSVIRY